MLPNQRESFHYCQPIGLSADLIDILKQFTKAAIRFQPNDVLAWAVAYFEAMAKGEMPPQKENLHSPVIVQKLDTGLTPSLLKVLHKQLVAKKTATLSQIEEKWLDLALPKAQFDNIVGVGSFSGQVEWSKFFVLAASALGENITDTMKMVCEVLTEDPECGLARIPFPVFKDLYTYLAKVDGEIPQETVDNAISHLQNLADNQEGFVMPRNFMSADCPPLS